MHANDDEPLFKVALPDIASDRLHAAISAFLHELATLNLDTGRALRITAYAERTPERGVTGRLLLLAENQDFVTWKSHDAPRRDIPPDDVRVSGFMADARYLLESLSTVTARHLTEAEVEQAVATQLYDLVAIMLTTALALAREEPEPITTAELLARCLEGMP